MDDTPRGSVAKSFLLYWLPAILWAALIFYLSSLRDPPEPGAVARLPGWDSLTHCAEYAVLGALLCRAVVGTAYRVPTTAYFLAVLAGAFYAASDELHQNYVPGRQMDPLDWMVDIVGILLGALLVLLWHLRRNKT